MILKGCSYNAKKSYTYNSSCPYKHQVGAKCLSVTGYSMQGHSSFGQGINKTCNSPNHRRIWVLVAIPVDIHKAKRHGNVLVTVRFSRNVTR